MNHRYGRTALVGIVLSGIAVVVGMIFLFIPATAGALDCGSVVSPRQITHHEQVDYIPQSTLVAVDNDLCGQARDGNEGIVGIVGGGGLAVLIGFLTLGSRVTPVRPRPTA